MAPAADEEDVDAVRVGGCGDEKPSPTRSESASTLYAESVLDMGRAPYAAVAAGALPRSPEYVDDAGIGIGVGIDRVLGIDGVMLAASKSDMLGFEPCVRSERSAIGSPGAAAPPTRLAPRAGGYTEAEVDVTGRPSFESDLTLGLDDAADEVRDGAVGK